MTAQEFAEFLRVAKDAGVEEFEVAGLKVKFASSPFAGALSGDSPMSKWTDREWGLAHTEGLPVPEKDGH